MQIWVWIKQHKLATVLILLVVYLVYRNFFGYRPLPLSSVSTGSAPFAGVGRAEPQSLESVGISLPPIERDQFAAVDTSERLVVLNSNLSLLVDDVRGVGEKIVDYASNQGGFMVSSSYSNPEESPFATVTVRVPSPKLNEALDFFRSQAIKVTSENLVGTDITEEFVDIEARIATLETTKAKFEEILGSATEVQDILVVQREIINTQTRIDALKGQRDALEKNAQLTKVTVYLSTDELALPYTPDEAFRPALTFKLAVRSLISAARSVGTAFIWIAVFAILWIPVLLIIYYFKRRKER